MKALASLYARFSALACLPSVSIPAGSAPLLGLAICSIRMGTAASYKPGHVILREFELAVSTGDSHLYFELWNLWVESC